MQLTGFKAANHLRAPRGAVPEGWYKVKVRDLYKHENRDIAPMGWKKNSKGTGYHLVYELEIVGVYKDVEGVAVLQKENPYRGKWVTERLNIEHTDENTVGIAKETLASMMTSAGVVELENGEADLCGKTLLVRIEVEPANKEYDASNNIVGYRSEPKDEASSNQGSPRADHNNEPWKGAGGNGAEKKSSTHFTSSTSGIPYENTFKVLQTHTGNGDNVGNRTIQKDSEPAF